MAYTKKDYYEPLSSNQFASLSGDYKSQSFVATSNYTIDRVTLKLLYSLSDHVTFYVRLYAADGSGLPTGSILATFGSFDIYDLTGSYVEYDFSDSSYSVTSGLSYCIVVEAATDPNVPFWFTETSNGYAGGVAAQKTYGGSWGIYNASYDRWFQLYEEDASAPEKPTTPTPANEDTEVDFSDLTLSWVDGGGADTYDVYIGDAEENLTLISSGQSEVSIVLSSVQRELFAGTCYWRVDATNEAGTTTGDVWWFTVEAPGKATDPTPADGEEDITVKHGIDKLKKFTWSAPDGETPDYKVYFRAEGGDWTLYDTITDDSTEYTLSSVVQALLEYYSIYEWRVDTYDPDTELTTTGDTWTFISEQLLSFTTYNRRSDYNADKVWQPTVGWVDIEDFEYTGGGRYKGRVLVIGHQTIYFGDL